MTFIVEDGTSVTDANSYGTIAGADTYFTDRGVTTWTGIDAEKQAALIKATDYIDTRFGSSVKGDAMEVDQSLVFPTDYWGAVIPANLSKGTYEYALRSMSAALAPDPTIDASIIRTKRVVGPITTENEYSEGGAGSVNNNLQPYPAADMLIAPLLRASNKVIR